MTVDGQLALMGITGALTLGGAVLIALFIRRVKVRHNSQPSNQAHPNVDLLEQIEARLADYFARIEEQQKTAAQRVQRDIRDLQCDLEWLASERVIDEAIALARTGDQPDNFNQQPDLTLDIAETIPRLRKH